MDGGRGTSIDFSESSKGQILLSMTQTELLLKRVIRLSVKSGSVKTQAPFLKKKSCQSVACQCHLV